MSTISSRPTALVIGASGQVGAALSAAFRDAYDMVGTGHSHCGDNCIPLDLGNSADVERVLGHVRPDVVLIAGAMCHVDGCEIDPASADRINAKGPASVARYLRAQGGFAVFYSTDHVFDGVPERSIETDPARPLSTYAKSKAAAEDALRRILPEQHLILRTGWVYGPDRLRRNFILRLVDRVRDGETVLVPLDQYGSPTYTDDLASATLRLVQGSFKGTFHATGPDYVNRMALAEAVARAFELPAGRIRGVDTESLHQAAPRTRRIMLDCSKLRSAGVPPFRGIQAGLNALAAWDAATRPEASRAR